MQLSQPKITRIRISTTTFWASRSGASISALRNLLTNGGSGSTTSRFSRMAEMINRMGNWGIVSMNSLMRDSAMSVRPP